MNALCSIFGHRKVWRATHIPTEFKVNWPDGVARASPIVAETTCKRCDYRLVEVQAVNESFTVKNAWAIVNIFPLIGWETGDRNARR